MQRSVHVALGRPTTNFPVDTRPPRHRVNDSLIFHRQRPAKQERERYCSTGPTADAALAPAAYTLAWTIARLLGSN